MSEYEVIFIVVITPKNTKRGIEFVEEEATYFFPTTSTFFFRIY